MAQMKDATSIVWVLVFILLYKDGQSISTTSTKKDYSLFSVNSSKTNINNNIDKTTTTTTTTVTNSNNRNKIVTTSFVTVDTTDNGITTRTKSSKKRVKVELYEEALCIDCQDFILNTLGPTYEQLGPEIIDLSIVAFGNAKYDTNSSTSQSKTLICQHGIGECDANSYDLCVADIYKYNINRYFPYIQCLYRTLPMGYHNTVFDTSFFASCARQTGIDWYVLQQCHDDIDRVQQLQQKAYNDTPKDHMYVPWIVINNVHWDQDEANVTFVQQICNVYNQHGGKSSVCDNIFATDTVAQV